MTALALTVPASKFSMPLTNNVLLKPQAWGQSAKLQQDSSDEELISAICLGADWALETLYQRYHRYAYTVAYRILHESMLAEDIVQDVFFLIWRKAASYQKQHGSVYSWLQAIVYHRAIDKVRSVAYREHHWGNTTGNTESEQDPPSGQPDVWEQVWHNEQCRLIHYVLAQLPCEQRHVIELAYFGGYTHAEIAMQWNMPLGTVKGRIRLALRKMKHLLEEREYVFLG